MNLISLYYLLRLKIGILNKAISEAVVITMVHPESCLCDRTSSICVT